MVKAVWGSDPRFSDGINFRFVRSEGRAFPKRRCLIPASEFRMGNGDHRYRVTLDSGNFFYLAALWAPPLADRPLSYRILTIPAGAEARTPVAQGTSVSVRVDLGCPRTLKQKHQP